MRKLAIFVLAVMIIVGVTVNANAAVEMEYVASFKELDGVVWDERHNAPQITVGEAYKTQPSWSERYFYKFCPEKDGIYTISMAEVGGKYSYVFGIIVDSNGNQVGDRCSNKKAARVPLKANTIYYFYTLPNSMHSYNGKVIFAICFEDQHPQNGIYLDITLPSCTEPGIQQSICQFCDVVSDMRECVL